MHFDGINMNWQIIFGGDQFSLFPLFSSNINGQPILDVDSFLRFHFHFDLYSTLK
jgi:hypothetical protein